MERRAHDTHFLHIHVFNHHILSRIRFQPSKYSDLIKALRESELGFVVNELEKY